MAREQWSCKKCGWSGLRFVPFDPWCPSCAADVGAPTTPDPRDAEIAALRADVERLKQAQAECITLMGDASRRAGYAEGQNDGLRRLMQAGIESLTACIGNNHRKDVDRTVRAVCEDFRRALATEPPHDR